MAKQEKEQKELAKKKLKLTVQDSGEFLRLLVLRFMTLHVGFSGSFAPLHPSTTLFKKVSLLYCNIRSTNILRWRSRINPAS
jgi:hypothetical protein